jgi:hypothetical protein
LADFQAQLSEQITKAMMETDIAVIVDGSAKLQDWFGNNKTSAALIRPDRYIAGTATSESELNELIHMHKTGIC